MATKTLNALSLAQLTSALLLEPEKRFPGSVIDEKAFNAELAELLLRHTGAGQIVSTPDNEAVVVDVPDTGAWQFMPEAPPKPPVTTSPVGAAQDSMTLLFGRRDLNGLLARNALSADQSVELHYEMLDWRLMDGEPVDLPSDTVPFRTAAYMGNQTTVEISDINGDVAVGFLLEIDHGIPALHLDMGGDILLHLRFTEDGLLLEPEYSMRKPERHEMGRHNQQFPNNSALLMELPDCDKPDYTSHPPVSPSPGP